MHVLGNRKYQGEQEDRTSSLSQVSGKSSEVQRHFGQLACKLV